MDITTILLSLIPVALGVTVVWTRVGKLLTALKELGDVLTVIVDALEDKQMSQGELNAIKKEIKEALAAFAAIFK